MISSFKADLQKAAKTIQKAKKILICAHRNPDGDTIGGQLALGLSLVQMGKKVTFVCHDPVPTRFQFLSGSELVLTDFSEKVDLAIAVDCGSPTQLGVFEKYFKPGKNSIQIDHHDFGTPFGKLLLLENEASAVGEVIYQLLRTLKTTITPSIATCLLTSIVIDTGSFRFSNIRPETFEICSVLVKTGINLQNLIEEAYWKKTRPMLKISSYALLQAQYSKKGTAVWSVLTQKDFKKFDAALPDADAVADELRSVEGVRVAAVLRETPSGNYRVSLRSRFGIHVAEIAKYFGGGGHHNSAGCSIKKQDLPKLLLKLEEFAS